MSHACGAYVRMLEAGLASIRIIETTDGEQPEEVTIVFRVYKSPTDGETVVGQFADGLETYSVPVADAFLQCHTAARTCGADAIRVDDPDGLFPPIARPSLPCDG